MVRQSSSELTDLEFHFPPLWRREIDLAYKTQVSDLFFQSRKTDKVTERKIPKFLRHYVNTRKSIYAEIETFEINVYVTAYVPSCCRIPHFVASVLSEYLTSHVSISNSMIFSDGLHFNFTRR